MIYAAMDVLILSVFLLIVGLWKPKVLLFWLDEPSRFAVVMIVSVLVMVGITMYGEGTRQKQLIEKEQQNKAVVNEKKLATKPNTDVPTTVETVQSKIDKPAADKKEKPPLSNIETATP